MFSMTASLCEVEIETLSDSPTSNADGVFLVLPNYNKYN